jgi:hypothetical protein
MSNTAQNWFIFEVYLANKLYIGIGVTFMKISSLVFLQKFYPIDHKFSWNKLIYMIKLVKSV